MSQVHAPWTEAQVAALTRWQNTHWVHPFTCGKRDGHPLDPEGDNGVLVATPDGWVCRHCDYTQDWAHDFMFDLPANQEEHYFLVIVSGCTAAQAETVMVERIGPDEDYGFDYTIDWERP